LDQPDGVALARPGEAVSLAGCFGNVADRRTELVAVQLAISQGGWKQVT